MLNYYSIILLGTLKIQTNLLQLATKISWNIPVCSPFILQQQHLENERSVYTWLYPHVWEAINQLYHSGKVIHGKISVALPALTQRGFSPNKTMQWPIFRPVKYEAANLNTTCQRFKVLDKSRDGIFTKRDQSQFDLDIDFSIPSDVSQ